MNSLYVHESRRAQIYRHALTFFQHLELDGRRQIPHRCIKLRVCAVSGQRASRRVKRTKQTACVMADGGKGELTVTWHLHPSTRSLLLWPRGTNVVQSKHTDSPNDISLDTAAGALTADRPNTPDGKETEREMCVCVCVYLFMLHWGDQMSPQG